MDQQTAKNQSDPQTLENFKELVREGNSEKLAKYFEQYGIAKEVALNNLNSLIAEELQDLSKD